MTQQLLRAGHHGSPVTHTGHTETATVAVALLPMARRGRRPGQLHAS